MSRACRIMMRLKLFKKEMAGLFDWCSADGSAFFALRNVVQYYAPAS
ncbi:hypothetical protein HanHA300_Chr07g0233001 [Helianthus annuus]|nr:hypothetical protein HanHA300_Chr07g0233001 [Helianthus annuus]KAJ0562341.1 hypothetical protein HanHA89_Chr07g0250171 [Helianthus annuus]KAJ0727717.1 hypothetical protein HanLR1_Chr07g0232951 [Helianthus annuus]